jgi:membrane-associated phospholipid phosphatase
MHAPRALPRQLLVPAAILLLALLLAPWDVPLARAWIRLPYSGTLRELFEMAEWFGHGLGTVAACLFVLTLDRARGRRLAVVVAAAGVLAGLAANVPKYTIPRIRPIHFLTDGTHRTLRTPAPSDDVLATFRVPDELHGNARRSLPSGHTAAAVALTVVLTAAYPHGRALFVGLAAMVLVQRMLVGAHYASDVLAGAALGQIIARGVLAVDAWIARRRAAVEPTTLELARPRAA